MVVHVITATFAYVQDSIMEIGVNIVSSYYNIFKQVIGYKN